MYPDSIIEKKGKLPGKTVAIFAGVHGNEKVGVIAIRKIINQIIVTRGTVYFVFANPPAIEKNKRIINANLNRLFNRKIQGETFEYKRSHELMDLLDTCDALLDIHSYNSESGNQFAISEKRGLKVLQKMDFPIVAMGFSSIGFGSDGYMEKQKKIGVCIECGTTNNYKKFIKLTENSIYQFLQYFNCVDTKVPDSVTKQKYIKAKRIVYKNTKNFKFVKEFKDFERLPKNKTFATDGEIINKASENECIIFPRTNSKVGDEVCIVGEIIDSKKF